MFIFPVFMTVNTTTSTSTHLIFSLFSCSVSKNVMFEGHDENSASRLYCVFHLLWFMCVRACVISQCSVLCCFFFFLLLPQKCLQSPCLTKHNLHFHSLSLASEPTQHCWVKVLRHVVYMCCLSIACCPCLLPRWHLTSPPPRRNNSRERETHAPHPRPSKHSHFLWSGGLAAPLPVGGHMIKSTHIL